VRFQPQLPCARWVPTLFALAPLPLLNAHPGHAPRTARPRLGKRRGARLPGGSTYRQLIHLPARRPNPVDAVDLALARHPLVGVIVCVRWRRTETVRVLAWVEPVSDGSLARFLLHVGGRELPARSGFLGREPARFPCWVRAEAGRRAAGEASVRRHRPSVTAGGWRHEFLKSYGAGMTAPASVIRASTQGIRA
jgi:hypothetical protein